MIHERAASRQPFFYFLLTRQRQLPPIGRTDDTTRLCIAPAVAVVPLVPTAPLALPGPVTAADALPDPLALASALARSPLAVALELGVPARSEAASRSRSRVVAVALADASGCSVVTDAALFGLLAVADALVLGDALLPVVVLVALELCAPADAGAVAIVPTISTR